MPFIFFIVQTISITKNYKNLRFSTPANYKKTIPPPKCIKIFGIVLRCILVENYF